MPSNACSGDHDAAVQLHEVDLSMMIADFRQFYQFSVYRRVWFCVPSFRCLGNSWYCHSHRMAMNRIRASDPFDLVGIGSDTASKARRHGLLRSATDSTDL